ncbi:MAG: MgtC/SapB family protein [Gammaproteobacteria bacterium]|nr:MgtC/SapB family protein [Gammaproteobacteria bacterium]
MFLAQTIFPNDVQNPAIYDPIVQLLQRWTGAEFTTIPWWVILIRLLLAFLVGGVLGAERATKSHAAGLRTYILVSVASCICMLVNLMLFQRADTARIPAGVLTGIGFIGAGTIITTSRHQIRGLTTAAALWACGCTGLAFGAGLYTIGLIATILIIFVVMFMHSIEGKLQKNVRMFDIHVELKTRTDLQQLLTFLREKNLEIKSVTYDPAYANSGLSVYSLSLHSMGSKKEFLREAQVLELVNALDYVNYCEAII